MQYNPLDPAVRANPYPSFAHLRENSPVALVEPFGFWAVSRYDDVINVLRSPALFSSATMVTSLLGELQAFPDAAVLIASDPPVHTRLRSLVNRAFTPRAAADLEPRVRVLVDDLVAGFADRGSCDVVAELAMPLPVIVIAELLGVDPARRVEFKRWSDDIVGAVAGMMDGTQQERIRGSIAAFMEYFQEVMDERRAHPRADLISALVQAEEQGQVLSTREVLAFTFLLLIAGNETTTNLIGNAVLALLAHPAELARVQADPSLIPGLVEETLRYDAPVQSLFRRATRDVVLGGVTIPEGATVLPLYGSANRDHRRFPDPDRFDITRDTHGHLGFGQGIHFCVGAPLARLEARVALEALLRTCGSLAPGEGHVERVESILLRGPKTLPLRFDAVLP